MQPKYEKNNVIERVRAERKAERDLLLGSDALSVNSFYFKDLAPKGWEILHLAGEGVPRVDETGRVHFKAPVRAVVLERADAPGGLKQKKVITLELPPDQDSYVGNGNFFEPFITEQDSELYKELRDEYMPELIAHRDWRNHPLPGRKRMRSLSESEQNAWDRWIGGEARRNPEEDALRWKPKDV